MQYIGIDIGASFIKAALFDTEKNTISRIFKEPAPSPVINSALKRNELCPESLWSAVYRTFLKVKGSSKIEGILISNQMHGFIIVDKTGEPLTNYISWQDHRGSDSLTLEKVRCAFGADGQKHTGMPLLIGLPSLNLCKLSYEGKINKGTFLSLGDYINYRFSGNFACHPTNCAGSGLMDLKHYDWNFSALEKMGCAGFNFPAIEKDMIPIGTTHDHNKSKVFPATGDQQAALLGSMLNSGELSLNIGTGSQVSMLSSLLEFGDYQVRPFFSDDFIKTITHIPAGRALNVLVAFSRELIKRTTNLDITPEEFWAAYQDIDYTRGNLDIDLSFFNGSSTGKEGSISHILESEFTMETLLAAAYRRMANNYYHFSQRIGGNNAKGIVISGGLVSKNSALLNAIQDTFRPLPVTQRFPEDTLVGLYILALSHEAGIKNYRKIYKIVEKSGIKIT